ncbi:MAG: PIG-L family deacetylase [Chloroflexi bacterium]|nr:PIG-L family deacetylase [Chloroflexota bacterium]
MGDKIHKHQTLLLFGAHPDDETFGIGATLATYVLRGVDVYYVCSTSGEEGTVDPEFLKDGMSIAELRRKELKNAAEVLGLADVIWLGYRDSGMAGRDSNSHPDCLATAPTEQVASRMVRIIRQLKPDVVVTHDAGGGYGHPDHIATHLGALMAFQSAGDPAFCPEAGPPFKPAKLYFSVRPQRLMKLIIKLMPLFGQNPHCFGRNGDIDLTRRLAVQYPVHARIRLTKQSREIQAVAAACHASQRGGQPRRGPYLFRLAEMLNRRRDYFMRAYPPPDGRVEKDLFDGVTDAKQQ